MQDKTMEIERKFLVTSTVFMSAATRVIHIHQGYLFRSDRATVRIRLLDENQARLTIKGASDELGISREEYEYDVPVADAKQMLQLCLPTIVDKYRYEVPYAGKLWEVDVFGGELTGLIVAEIELGDIDEHFALPEWVGDELTGDMRYYNVSLATNGLPH